MTNKRKTAPTRLFGIDVSHHQNIVQWDKVAVAGAKYAFLKASEGSSFKDKRFASNRKLATEAGLPVGGYHFFRPNAPVERQISNFVSSIGSMRDGELPPVLDIEVPEIWRNLSLNQRVKIVRQWLDGVQNALGVQPIIYLSSSFAGEVLNNQAWLKDYKLWVAHYSRAANPRTPEPWKSSSGWTFWQYSESGRLDGVSTKVDMNRFNGDSSALDQLLWKSKESKGAKS